MIRKAEMNDLHRVKAITEACAEALIQKGIAQWNASYPSLAVFKNDIENGDLYVIENQNTLIGCIMFSGFKDKVYNSVHWLTPDHMNLYIHRLAVHPDFQKQGHAKTMMDFAENYALKNNFRSIRLDTFSKNKDNQMFYKKKGFNQRDDVYFPNQSPFPFHCYEKVLENI